MFEAFGDVASGVGYPGPESRRDAAALYANYVPWIAAGAVVAGAIGAVVGCMRLASRPRHRQWPHWPTSVDSRDVTAPHGDKLMPRH